MLAPAPWLSVRARTLPTGGLITRRPPAGSAWSAAGKEVWMKPEERPPPGSRCVVDGCQEPATTYADVGDGYVFEAERGVVMCEEHAAHWRAGST